MHDVNCRDMESKSNKKKTNKNKKARVQDVEEHAPEVFVLPPNILHKLGIHLEKVASNQENLTADNSVPELSNNKLNSSQNTVVAKELQKPQRVDAIKDVSLMETATLMKESVFLSPSFAPITSNTGELEFLAKNNETVPQPILNSEFDSLINCGNVKESDKHQGTGIIKHNDQHLSITPNLDTHTNMIVSDISPVKRMFLTNISVECVEVPVIEISKELEGVPPDDHLDEAYLSDCSTSNLEPVENLNHSIQTPKNGKKITIISEETLTSYQCNARISEISNLLSHACPVSRGTLISVPTSEIHLPVVQNNFDLSVESIITPMRSYPNKIRKDKWNTVEVDIQNECLSDCMDISVTDIEAHLKEDEEILQEFANEIISNDSSDIINKIERSEKLSEESNAKDITNYIDRRNTLSVSQYTNDQLFENQNICFYNIPNNGAPDQEIFIETKASDLNCMLTGVKQNNINNNMSNILNCENNHTASKLNLNWQSENSNDTSLTESTKSLPQNNVPISVMSEMDKNKDNNMKKNINQHGTNNHEEKVEEITKYLKEYLNRTKPKSLTKANELCPRKLEHKDLKSNQGVEKPGGHQQEHQQRNIRPKPIKTYGKATNKGVPKSAFSPNRIYTEDIKLEEMSTLILNEQNTLPVSDNTLQENFCLCGDFGRKAFYDSDTPYKHIHFWEQRVSNIVPDLVYSIFSNDGSTSNPDNCNLSPEKFQENDTHEMELALFNICWNSLETEYVNSNVTKCINNLHNVQQEKSSVSQNVAQVSENVHNKCETLSSTNKHSCTKNEASHNHENTTLIQTRTETTKDAYFSDDVSEKITKSTVEQSQIELNCSVIEESTVSQSVTNDTTIQNESDNEQIIVIQVQESLEFTDAEEAHNLSKEISFVEEEAQTDVKDKTKESLKDTQTQKARRFIFDNEIDIGQVPLGVIKDASVPESKKKKAKKCSEPTRKPRRLTYEDKIAGVADKLPKTGNKKLKKRRKSSMQVGSDEEPLSIKKARKHKSLDNESLESSNVSKSNVDVVVVNRSGSEENKVHCGVCSLAVNASDWFQHIGKEHSYVAWKLGEPSVDMEDEEQFESHLKEILKQTGGLVCSKCGLIRKYVKSYLKHINQCDANVAIKLEINSHDNADTSTDTLNKYNDLIKCGVCHKEVHPVKWMKHIQMAHNYLAWKHGETLDLDSSDAVNEHLVSIVQKEGQLTCSKCGLERKYVKKYLDHIRVCTAECTFTQENDDDARKNAIIEGDIVCAVCKEIVQNKKKWNVHNMKKHYNLAWIQGEPPVVSTSLHTIERLLKEYKDEHKELTCTACGISRVSCMGFYAHILVCGKSEEEIEKNKLLCNICNKQYLFLYQSQHMLAHREQERAKERKKQAEVKKAMVEQATQETPSGRRRAAENARTFIKKYNENTTATYKCEKCSFSTELKKELKKHKCGNDAADSDATPSEASESEDSHDDDDSNVSEEEEQKMSAKRGKKDIAHSPVVKAKVLPFIAAKPKEYVIRSGLEHYKTYLSSEGLFPEWRHMACEAVPEQDVPSYMPPLEESCKVRVSGAISGGEWQTHKRFEAAKNKGVTSVFVGASVQCARWATPRAQDQAASQDEDSFLAVAVHRGADAPRFSADETRSHPALIQIWDFGDFKDTPKFVFGLAHDYGTVWSMDWCPSGARDAPDSEAPRLGLLATACSDGIVHVYSVPYPPSTCEQQFYKIKPVAELRISSSPDRKLYQATAVKWCKQVGHALIFVGYSDGTTAYYDVTTDSPLLRSTENGITVLYPYFDERCHTSCVTDVSTFPCGARAGAAISCAPSGVHVTSSPALRPRRRGTHHAAISADFDPLFPHAIFATDSSRLQLSSPPELDWVGAGRPLGTLSALAGCARCGLCLAYAAPQLRTMRPHPAYLETNKKNFGALDMISLCTKRKKPLKEDNLTTIVEPTTYEEAIKKYGVELRIDKNVKPPSNSRHRDIVPERFPLANPSSMVFCPAPAHHGRVAIATHSGVIFVILVSA